LYASKGEDFIPLKSHCSCVSSNEGEKKIEFTTDFFRLNVGGKLFCTSSTTLLNREPNSMLSRMFDPTSNMKPSCVDSSGAYLIDRDPKYFGVLLNYLRTGTLVVDPGINPKGWLTIILLHKYDL